MPSNFYGTAYLPAHFYTRFGRTKKGESKFMCAGKYYLSFLGSAMFV